MICVRRTVAARLLLRAPVHSLVVPCAPRARRCQADTTMNLARTSASPAIPRSRSHSTQAALHIKQVHSRVTFGDVGLVLLPLGAVLKRRPRQGAQ